MAKITFDATGVAPQQPLEPIPTNWYSAFIAESEVVPTKESGGTMLKLVWQIADGEFKGRKVFDRINIKNKSAQAQEIGQAQLSAICHATGVLRFKDTVELHNKPMQIRVVLRPPEGQYDASNEVKSYKPLEGGAPVASTPAAAVPAFVKKGAAAAPVAAPAAPGKKAPTPPTPVAPPPAPEPTVVPDERMFYLHVEGENIEKNGDEVREMLEQGMPADTPIVLQDEADQGWKTVADYGLDQPNVAAEPEPTPAPAAPTPPTPPAGANPKKPSWLQGKKK